VSKGVAGVSDAVSDIRLKSIGYGIVIPALTKIGHIVALLLAEVFYILIQSRGCRSS
jgi:hypothetical protein